MFTMLRHAPWIEVAIVKGIDLTLSMAKVPGPRRQHLTRMPDSGGIPA